MFNNVVLDVVIGLVFIYLLYSLLATIVQEIISTRLAFRSKVLEKAILRMLEDGKTTTRFRIGDRIKGFVHLFGKPNLLKSKQVATWFYAHPLIKYLGEDNYYSKPAYLSSQNFSKVILDLLQGMETATGIHSITAINNSINDETIHKFTVSLEDKKEKSPAMEALKMQHRDVVAMKSAKDQAIKEEKSWLKKVQVKLTNPPEKFKDIKPGETVPLNSDTALFLKSLWRDSGADVEKFKQKLEKWFDDTMERVTGWYKRYTQVVLFIIGIIIAVGFNVDTIKIAKKLAKDPKLREQMVQNAIAYAEKQQEAGSYLQQLKSLKQDTTEVSANLESRYDKLTKRTDSLTNLADSLLKNEIKNVSDLMALGWHAKSKHTLENTGGFLCFKCNDMGTDFSAIFKAIIGWLITALAICLGAPFWFDLLNKLVKLRGTGTKIDSTGQTTRQGKDVSAAPVTVNVNTKPGEEAVG